MAGANAFQGVFTLRRMKGIIWPDSNITAAAFILPPTLLLMLFFVGNFVPQEVHLDLCAWYWLQNYFLSSVSRDLADTATWSSIVIHRVNLIWHHALSPILRNLLHLYLHSFVPIVRQVCRESVQCQQDLQVRPCFWCVVFRCLRSFAGRCGSRKLWFRAWSPFYLSQRHTHAGPGWALFA